MNELIDYIRYILKNNFIKTEYGTNYYYRTDIEGHDIATLMRQKADQLRTVLKISDCQGQLMIKHGDFTVLAQTRPRLLESFVICLRNWQPSRPHEPWEIPLFIMTYASEHKISCEAWWHSGEIIVRWNDCLYILKELQTEPGWNICDIYGNKFTTIKYE